MARSAMKVISILTFMVLLLAVLAEEQPKAPKEQPEGPKGLKEQPEGPKPNPGKEQQQGPNDKHQGSNDQQQGPNDQHQGPNDQPQGPKSKMVKCQDKGFPNCYPIKQYCPDACPSTCDVDCVTCQPVCGPLPPPPPYIPSAPSPTKQQSPPPPPTYTPPTWNPPPVTTPPQSPPAWTPPISTPPPSVPTSTPPPVSTPPSTPVSTAPTMTPPPVSIPPSPPVSTPPTSPPTLTPPPSSTPPSPPSSNSTPSTPPNSPPEVSGKRVYCKNRYYPQCYRMEQRCPSACPDSCEVDCVTCSPVCNCNRPGAVCQDPRFIGADGITFYFHGKKDRDFCIVSDSNLHINAHFIGRRNENMKRDFTWVQSLGILFDNNKIFIGAKRTATWDNAVDRLDLAFNGQPIFLSEGEGAKWEPIAAPGVSITRFRDTNAVVIEVVGNFKIKATVVPITQKESQIHKYGITEEDCFAHLDLSFKFYSLTGSVNGVLGQTYASNYVSRVKMGIDMPVLGGDKEFASSNLFSTDCAVARFSGTVFTSSKNFEYAKLNCVSGLNGGEVVCKR